MGVLKQFEIQVVRFLASSVLAQELIETVINEAEFVSYEYSGSGYFLTIQHSALSADRTVCSKPTVMGQIGEVSCGFVLFIENHELTLECHSWGLVNIPDGFREEQVHITINY